MKVALLWHLHQPDYRNPVSGVPFMPWARLHGLRGYRDLLVEALEDPLPSVINLVPSLLDQLVHYADGGSDPHLDLTRRPANQLSDAEVQEIRDTFVGGHPVLRAPYRPLEEAIRSGRALSPVEVLDLQVWSTLAWFGATARRDHPQLDALRRKERGYSEQDKERMLEVQERVLAELPSLWRRVGEAANGVSFSVSAYNHPILPLLVDARHAKRSLPDVPDDVDFAWPEDALAQLVSARERVKLLAGVDPVGLWPSEGAVSPEVALLAARAGFRWMCSDRGVLQASAHTVLRAEPGGWELGHGLTGFFRDTDLSDRIGFRYSTTDPEEAVADFLAAARTAARGGLAVVALDGENPWETFADAGGAFRAALREGLRSGPVEPVNLDDVALEPVVGIVERLHTGSWIGADLAIWFGHEEDRRAWRALGELRKAAQGHPRQADAMRHIYAAEGSDWFWWYGDDFRTPFAGRFDALFRAHLQAGWRALGLPAPEALERPLLDPDPVSVKAQSRWLLGPIGPSWPSQAGCGRVGITQGAMARGRAPELLFGWELGPQGKGGTLHLRLEGRGQELFVDGRAFSAGSLEQPHSLESVSVQVLGPEGPAWVEPVTLAAPATNALWTTGW